MFYEGRERTRVTTDVAIVGASLAGCAAARLLGTAGIRVALIEKHADQAAYKRLCGHYIQASATPVIERLRLRERIENAGGVRNGADAWTRWGWIRPRPEGSAELPHGYSIRRSKLDPMIRRLAVETPGVSYLGGTAAVALVTDGDETRGVIGRDRAGREARVDASLVVGADGRSSSVAKLAGASEKTRSNERFCYMAYYAGIPRRPDGRGRFWMIDRDVVIAVPNDDDITLVALFPHKDRLAAFETDREAAFEALARKAPGMPPLTRSARISKFVGYKDYPLAIRSVVPRTGVALIGDAALTADPVWAIGCGWALQSAAWLADSVLPALHGEEPLGRGLRRYRRTHHRNLAGHARVIGDAARAEPPPLPVRAMLAAATRDPRTARRFERFVTRSIAVRDFLGPTALARAAWVNARS